MRAFFYELERWNQIMVKPQMCITEPWEQVDKLAAGLGKDRLFREKGEKEQGISFSHGSVNQMQRRFSSCHHRSNFFLVLIFRLKVFPQCIPAGGKLFFLTVNMLFFHCLCRAGGDCLKVFVWLENSAVSG